MSTPKKPLNERIAEAEDKAAMYLGNYNEAEESGPREKAAKLYTKAQFWLDRYNLLTNQSNRPAPRR